MAMSALIKSLEDIMRKDAGLNGDAQYIEQITWLLFLKAFDAKEMEWKFRPDYRGSTIPEGYRWRDWADDKEGITGDALIKFVDELFDKLKKLDVSDGDLKKFVVRNVFADINNYMKSGIYLRQLINRINEKVDFIDATQKHTFNELYEGMLKDLQSAGRAGEFYTPRPVTNFIVEKIDPKLGETVLDPACGTGGFLTSTIAHMGSITTTEQLNTLQTTIFGWEKKPLPYLLAMTNLILHDIETPQIRHINSLNRPVTDYSAKDRVDVIVANPPFGGAEDDAVKQNFPAEFRTSETADLFLVLMMHLLKDKGRCGVVLPDGFMFGDGVKAAIKKRMLDEYGLHTIIRLPQVFKPYANVNTNLLFFQKGVPSRGVWFYRLDYPEGVKSFTKTKPMQDKHFDPVREWWADKQPIVVDGNDKARFFTVEELVDLNYNFDKCCPFPYEEEEILEPAELIARYQAERSELNTALDNVISYVTMKLNGNQIDAVETQSELTDRLIKLQRDFPVKLRKSILQQALQGKLTERDPNDEAASKLIKHIRAEKAALIAEGKIKKEKPLPPIADDEKPFDIPETWEWVRWGDLSFSIQYGYNAPAMASGRIKMVRISDIQDNKVLWDTVPYCDIKEEDIEAYLLKDNDILFARTGGTVGKSFLVQSVPEDAIYAGYLIRTQYSSSLVPKYLKFFMESQLYWNQLRQGTIATAQPNCNGKTLSKMILPLPPLDEQKRIVSRIEDLFAMCNKLK